MTQALEKSRKRVVSNPNDDKWRQCIPTGIAWRCSGAFSLGRYRKDGIFMEASCQNKKIKAELFSSTVWGSSSAGRALRSQCRGREFDPPLLHHDRILSAPSRRSDACFHRRFSYLQGLHNLHLTPLRTFLFQSLSRLNSGLQGSVPRGSPILHSRYFCFLCRPSCFLRAGIHCFCMAGFSFLQKNIQA